MNIQAIDSRLEIIAANIFLNSRKEIPVEDLKQSAWVAILENSYNYKRIYGAMIDEFRNWNIGKRQHKKFYTIPIQHTRDIPVLNCFYDTEIKLTLHSLLKNTKLTDAEQYVLDNLLQDLSIEDISRKKKVTQGAISQSYKSLITKLRKNAPIS